MHTAKVDHSPQFLFIGHPGCLPFLPEGQIPWPFRFLKRAGFHYLLFLFCWMISLLLFFVSCLWIEYQSRVQLPISNNWTGAHGDMSGILVRNKNTRCPRKEKKQLSATLSIQYYLTISWNYFAIFEAFCAEMVMAVHNNWLYATKSYRVLCDAGQNSVTSSDIRCILTCRNLP